LFIFNKLMFQSKLFLVVILLIILHGSCETSYQNRKVSQLYKHRSQDHDNRYVWFTRDIHDNDNQRKILLKKLTNHFYRKHSNKF
jgi:hypothetical protein